MEADSPYEKPGLCSAYFRSAIVVALAAVAAVGCSTAPVSLKLAPELASVVAKPVSGRSGNEVRGALAFDRWSAAVTMQSHEDRLASANEELSVDARGTAFEFDLHSNGAPPSASRGQCIARGRSGTYTTYHGRTTDETSVTVPGYPRVDCEFAGAQAGRLTVRPTFVTQRDLGSAQFGEQLWEIRSVNNLDSQRTEFPLARFGYEIRAGGRVVAAVETWGAGRVWMDPGLGPQDEEELSVVMTALLYYGSLLEVDDT
ncbi:MAG TPA: hypothetical protein VGO61_19540 [Steroidobacteraceae bacterium]|jgi:hypothetical protein|nr:hypothetical protein [Steroidobacteraceae bacterium]